MLAREVVIGEKYVARISGVMTVVEIINRGYRNSWVAKNLRDGERVYFKTCACLWCQASKESMKTYLGFVPVEKFVIPDGPRCESLDAIVEKLMAGATLPKPKPLPKPLPEPTPATWAEQNFRVDQSVQVRLAKIVIALTLGRNTQDLRDETGLDYSRCEEILKIRDKLIDLLG
jgi:hypothetical protein